MSYAITLLDGSTGPTGEDLALFRTKLEASRELTAERARTVARGEALLADVRGISFTTPAYTLYVERR